MTDQKSGVRKQRRTARHRHPRTAPADGRAGDAARRDDRFHGAPHGQDVDRQGLPGPRGALRRSGRSCEFEDQELTYRQANETANRYAAVLAARGVGHGDVVGIMLRNSPQTVLLMLAVVKCGAIAGMLNYHQRGDVLAHSIGLLDAKAVVAETDLIEPITDSGADTTGLMTLEELDRLAATAPTQDPATTAAVLAKDKAFYIFTSGTTGMPKASVMTHYRWLRALAGFGGLGLRLHSDDVLYCCLPLYHNNALTVALGSTVNAGATLALGKSFSASKFWDDVIRYQATAFIYIGEICAYLLNQPPKDTDRKHKVRVIIGNGLRPAIWDDFTKRFGIPRVCEFYGASEGNTAFVNVLNIDKSTGICPTPVAFVEYDAETGDPVRDDNGRVRKVKTGEPGLLLSKVSNFQPFDGYTDKKASEKKLVRDAFKEGDTWFNTGDLMRSQGFGHAAFTDRLGDTFRWKGENVATTEVEAAVSTRLADRGGHRVRRRGRRCGRSRRHGRDPAQGRRGVRRQGPCESGLRAPARLRRAVVRPGGVRTRSHVDVQEPEGGPAQGGLRRHLGRRRRGGREDRGPDLRPLRSR